MSLKDSPYQVLCERFQRIASVEHALTLLGWDQAVMMPPGGAASRATAMADLGGMSHEMLLAEDMAKLLDEAEAQAGDLSPQERANLVEMRREWRDAACLPKQWVIDNTLATQRCEHAWREQRKNNDWSGLAENLKGVVQLARAQAQYRQEAMGRERFPTPYDALLSLYANGDSSALVGEVFTTLKAELPTLIDRIIERQNQQPSVSLQGPFDLDKQAQLGRKVTRMIGFDFEAGRLDVSAHPFSTGVPGDQRITTRYDADNLLEALLGTIHETGHASYEAGLPSDWRTQPAGRSRNMSIHESQSLFFEKQVALSPAFAHCLSPMLQTLFGDNVAFAPEALCRAMQRVEKGLIRTSADEATYPLHVVLRFEIERDLINGDIEVEDIPALWHQGMQAYLGLETQGNDRDGCMQDIHWPSGGFGYFPTYTLGAVNAAQLMHTLRQQVSDIDEQIQAGEFAQIRQWLGKHVWQRASFTDSQTLMREATGEGTHARFLIDHLQRRYMA